MGNSHPRWRMMSDCNTGYHSHGYNSTDTQIRHSADDALESKDFQLLLEGTYELGDYYAIESRLIALALGRLGMRVGELVHMRESWIDWKRRMIQIPRRERCHKGTDNGPCGYCKQLAEQQANHNEGMTYDDALRRRWQAKTDAAARSIPYDFDPKAEVVIERYFDRFDEFQTSKSGVNRRLEKTIAQVDELNGDNIYPHCLRATAASYHASRGLDAISLQSMLGWSQLSTAHRYVRRSGDRTRRALQSIHSQ